jgi:hypothetical protein
MLVTACATCITLYYNITPSTCSYIPTESGRKYVYATFCAVVRRPQSVRVSTPSFLFSEEYYFLKCDAIQPGKNYPMFRRIILPP